MKVYKSGGYKRKPGAVNTPEEKPTIRERLGGHTPFPLPGTPAQPEREQPLGKADRKQGLDFGRHAFGMLRA